MRLFRIETHLGNNIWSGMCTMDLKEFVQLPLPKHNKPITFSYKNAPFFFTSVGWNKYGKKIYKEYRKQYETRLIIIDSSIGKILYKDKYQVVLRMNKAKCEACGKFCKSLPHC